MYFRISVFAICIALASAGANRGNGEPGSDWHNHPQHTYHRQATHSNSKPEQVQVLTSAARVKYGDDDMPKNVRRFTTENAKLVDQVIERLWASYRTKPNGYQRLECPNSGPPNCPPTNKRSRARLTGKYVLSSIKSGWNTLSRAIAAESENCEPCISAIDVLKSYVCDRGLEGWEPLRDAIISLCETLFPPLDLDPVMCNGTVTLQGQHLYCILMEADSSDCCESLGACYPEDTRTRTPVSERTPWALKPEAVQDVVKKTEAPTKKAKDGLVMVAQLTDIHVQHNHMTGAPSECNAYICCLESSSGTHPAREYGEYSCNLPPRTLDLFMDRVQDSNPDFVLYAGDSPPHTIWDETLISQLNCSQSVVNAMERSFPEGTRVYANIGNHEMYPTNLFSLRMPETVQMTQEFTNMWHKLGGFDQAANDTMSTMGYYTVLVPGHSKLRIMSINTNYDWYNANFYSVLNEDSTENAEHKDWVASTLLSARSNGEKVIVIAHHPIGGGSTHIRTSRWWEEITNEYGDVIVLHVSGHTHKNHFVLSFDHDTMEAKSINQIEASTTTNTNVNPTLRMFYLDPDNDYSLVDFENFYLDVKTQNQSIGVPPVIAFSYSAVEDYGLPDMSPNSWKELVFRFIDDDELFQTYYKNIKSSASDSHCNANCKASQICNMWFAESSEAEECIGLAPDPTTTTPAPTTPAPTTTTIPPEPTSGTATKATVAGLSVLLCNFVWLLFGLN